MAMPLLWTQPDRRFGSAKLRFWVISFLFLFVVNCVHLINYFFNHCRFALFRFLAMGGGLGATSLYSYKREKR